MLLVVRSYFIVILDIFGKIDIHSPNTNKFLSIRMPIFIEIKIFFDMILFL